MQKSDSNTMGRSRERRTSEIQVSLEELPPMSGAHTARDVFTNTVDTVSENNAGCELARQKQRSRVLHADVDQDLFAEPPEPDEWNDAGLKEDEVWRLNKALYGYRKAPKLWHHHLESILESLNYHS